VKVLVVGEGGREDALAWALARSPSVSSLSALPGSAGIARRARTVPMSLSDLSAVVAHVTTERYDLVVVGPEGPLVAGLGDRLRAAGIAVFGPSAAAAEIEASKAYSKEFLARHRIPTAQFHVFTGVDDALRYLRSTEVRFPVVVKADGLAAGKGVVIAGGLGEAEDAAREMLSGRSFGASGARIVVEEFLEGTEVSFFVLSDGTGFVRLSTCQDYKRASDGNHGANTGGMGSYSPSVYLDEVACRAIESSVVTPTLDGLRAEGRPYQGVLYIGLMLTASGPKVLEFNARFGDPETQVLLPRLDGDWLPLLLASATGGVAALRPRWLSDATVCVVLASGGYPGDYARGKQISGLEAAESAADVMVFHAGTDRSGDRWVTRGGRVLGVTAKAATLAAARERAYEAAAKITWDGKQYRSDIALDALSRAGGGTQR